MYVHPFWFGVLMAIVAMIVLFLGFGIVRALTSEEDEDDEDFEQVLTEMTGKKFRIVRKNGYLIGEPIDDEDDHDDDHQ